MNLLTALKVIWRRKLFIIYMCFLGAVVSLCIKTFVFKNTYTYVLDFYITDSELAKLIFDVNTIDNDVQMAKSCRIILKSELALDTVGEMLVEKYGEDYLSSFFDVEQGENGLTVSFDQLYNCIEIEQVKEGTAVLEVRVENGNPYLAEDIGRFLTYIAPYIIYYYVGADYISPYENARLITNYSLPGNKVFALGGVCVAFVLAAGFALLSYKLSERIIFSDGDIKETTSQIILGNVPYYKMENIDEGQV